MSHSRCEFFKLFCYIPKFFEIIREGTAGMTHHRPLTLTLMIVLLLPTLLKGDDNWGKVGDVLQVAIPISALGFTVIERDFKGSKQAVFALTFTQMTVWNLKVMFETRRPNGGKYSFPSGHTAISFASAGFMQRRYGWKLGVPYIGVATLVAVSRVAARAHRVEDVVIGAAIGWIYSRIFTLPLPRHFSLYPEATSQSASLCCSYCF
jgi:membrane-associated phospholipid phosphatase